MLGSYRDAFLEPARITSTTTSSSSTLRPAPIVHRPAVYQRAV